MSMSAVAHGRLLDDLVSWLNRRLAPEGVVIGPDTELFSGGLVDSMRILDLIAYTEVATGRTISDEEIRMDRFATARRIVETFGGG